MEQLMTVGKQLRLWITASPAQAITDKLMAVGIGLVMLAIIPFEIIFLYKNQRKFHRPNMIEKYDILFDGLKLRKKLALISYAPVFLIKRMIFVLIPTIFYTIPSIQIQILVFMQSIYIIYYFTVEPYITRY
jgi:hypothetical protein